MRVDEPAWQLPSFWSDGDLGPARLAWATATLREYFSEGPGSEYWYSGARFERLGGGGDRLGAVNEFTADDLVAVSMLSVDVPGHAAIRFLETDRTTLSHLLRSIPADVDLLSEEAAGFVEPGAEADKLWSALRRRPGTGRTTTSKLLARKRPRLLPVYDSVVAEALGLRDSRDYWRGIRQLLRSEDDRFPDFLKEVREASNLQDVALLRVFDVLVWMSSPRRRPPR